MAYRPTKVKGYETLGDLTQEIANLRYDSFMEFLLLLGMDIADDADDDYFERDYVKVASHLKTISDYLIDAGVEAADLWSVCKPKMKLEEK